MSEIIVTRAQPNGFEEHGQRPIVQLSDGEFALVMLADVYDKLDAVQVRAHFEALNGASQ